jgi:hypothetical protein
MQQLVISVNEDEVDALRIWLDPETEPADLGEVEEATGVYLVDLITRLAEQVA